MRNVQVRCEARLHIRFVLDQIRQSPARDAGTDFSSFREVAVSFPPIDRVNGDAVARGNFLDLQIDYVC